MPMGSGCTGPVTWAGGARTATWSTWGGSITRSRSAGTGSRWVRSRPPCSPTRRSSRSPSWLVRTRWSRTWCRRANHPHRRTFEHTCGRACRTTWCRRRSSNGKLDRAALPEPGVDRPELESEFVAPRTPTEQVLAEIWASVLGLEEVGVTDDFFDLGGHSILVTRVASAVRETFGVELPLGVLFVHQTVAELAVMVEELILEEIRGRMDSTRETGEKDHG